MIVLYVYVARRGRIRKQNFGTENRKIMYRKNKRVDNKNGPFLVTILDRFRGGPKFVVFVVGVMDRLLDQAKKT